MGRACPGELHPPERAPPARPRAEPRPRSVQADSAVQEGLKHLKALTAGAGGGAGGGGGASSGAAAGGAAAAAASGPIVFCVGEPGAGKTTVCRMLEEKYKATYYAAGDPQPQL